MGYINEIFDINKSILEYKVHYSKIDFIGRLIYKRNINKLKKSIEKINDNKITTGTIAEYAKYVLENYNINNTHIKQILKGDKVDIGTITFSLEMEDQYSGMVTINFDKNTEDEANYIFVVLAPNSAKRIPYSEYNKRFYDVTEYENLIKNTKGDMSKVYQLQYTMVKTINEDIKKFLLNNIGDMEIGNG